MKHNKRAALCRKITGHETHSSTLTSNWRKPWGSDAAREPYISCCGGLYQWIHQARAVTVCKERRCYGWTCLVGSCLRDFLLFRSSGTWFNSSHQSKWPPPPSRAPGSLPALSPLKKPREPDVLCEGPSPTSQRPLWLVTHGLQAVRVPFGVKRDSEVSALGGYIILMAKENAKQ